MFVQSERQTFFPWTSFAEVSPVKTCLARERAKALLASARASGVSSLVWSARFDPDGSLSKTSRAVHEGGSTRSCVSWKSSAMRAYRAQLRRAMSALLTIANESSLLPTLAVDGNYNRRGASKNSGDGLRTALLPTLTVCQRDNRGGADPNGPERPSLTTLAKRKLLPTLTSSLANRGGARESEMRRHSPSLDAILRTSLGSAPVAAPISSAVDSPSPVNGARRARTRSLLPTLTTRDEKGPGLKHTRGGRDLPQTLGGHLNPDWCRWFMGFPAAWLDVDDAPAFVRSATRSSRSARKSSGG